MTSIICFLAFSKPFKDYTVILLWSSCMKDRN